MKLPQKGFYYHYKHDPKGEFNNYAYEVVGVGRNTEEGTYAVLYRPLYENDWIKPAGYLLRPLQMFMESVTKEGVTLPRFTLVTEPEMIKRFESLKSKFYDQN